MDVLEVGLFVAITVVVLLGWGVLRALYVMFAKNKAIHTEGVAASGTTIVESARQAKAKTLLVGILNACIGIPFTVIGATFAADAGPNPFSSSLMLIAPLFLLVLFIPQIFFAMGKYEEVIVATRYALRIPWYAILVAFLSTGLFGFF